VRINVVSRVVAMIGIVGLLVPVAQAGLGSGGGTPRGANGAGTFDLPLECRVINDNNDLTADLFLTDVYGTLGVQVKGGQLICTILQAPVFNTLPLFGRNPNPPPAAIPIGNALKCYQVSQIQTKQPTPPHPAVISTDAFGIEEDVSVGAPQFLCVPAAIGP
jgi:hypothetical protein